MAWPQISKEAAISSCTILTEAKDFPMKGVGSEMGGILAVFIHCVKYGVPGLL